MNFPSPYEIDCLNYLLLVVASLGGSGHYCSVTTIKRLCSTRVFNGVIVDYSKIIEVGKRVGMLSCGTRGIKLTDTAVAFIELNQQHSFQITDVQRLFFLENCIFSGPCKTQVRSFFKLFSPNHERVTFEFSTFETPMPVRHNAVFHTLRQMKVLLQQDYMIRVAPEYVPHVKKIRAEIQGISEAALRAMLESDEELASLAEERVLEYERQRLISLGRVLEAQSVRRISGLDVAAGYDIESFDGSQPEIEPSRLIEVKASKMSKLRFYWSVNELRVAERLGERYWIYFVGDFAEKKTDIEPIMIQNPAQRIKEITQLQIEVSKYIVFEQGELPLKRNDMNMPGYVL